MYPLGLGSTTLHFDWLWFVSLCVAKRTFLLRDKGEFVGTRTNIWSVVIDYVYLAN